MRHLKTSLAVLGGVTVLVLAGNTVAMAATGQNFLLGKGNNANAQTTLARTTAGTVLSLRGTSLSGTPLAVNGRGKVTNLNADTIDGYDSTVLRDKTYLYTREISAANATTSYEVPLTGLPVGTYEIGYSAYANGTLAEGDTITCYLDQLQGVNSLRFVGEDRSYAIGGNRPSVSGSGVLAISGTQTVSLICDATFAFYTYASEPIQVYANPTTIVGGSSNLRVTAPKAVVKQ